MYQLFKSTFFNFEIVRLLSTAPFGGCEPGELLDHLDDIKDGDPESWYTELYHAAINAEAFAKEAQLEGNRLATRRAFLRAGNYYRAAQFMLNGRPGFEDHRIQLTTEKSISAFRKGFELLDGEVQVLEIPYEKDKTLLGYLFLPPTNKRLPGGKTPVLICTGGLDATAEELYLAIGADGTQQGYAVLIFDGPGQGAVLRRYNLHMRHDWEVVISSVIDKLYSVASEQTQLQLDLEHIAITGSTLGGTFALRAASDPRISACIAIDPFYSMYDVAVTRMPPLLLWAWTGGYISDATFSAIVGFAAKLDFKVRWEFGQIQWAFGKRNPAEVMRAMRKFAVTDDKGTDLLKRIRCPVMVTGAAASLYSLPEASTYKIFEKLDHLGEDQKHLWVGRTVTEGGLQAKVGAFGLVQQRIYAFLDQQFGIDRSVVC